MIIGFDRFGYRMVDRQDGVGDGVHLEGSVERLRYRTVRHRQQMMEQADLNLRISIRRRRRENRSE
jgi:hypothetical protein